MHVVRHMLFAFCLTLFALPGMALAASNTPASMYSQDTGFTPQMLDASRPETERLKDFARVMQRANAGVIRAQDLAGTMYWQGARVKGSPVKTNMKQAHILLSNAAVHGDVLAMAKMAELELQARKPQKAMVWAQLYAHYIDPLVSAREQHGRRYNYATDLMIRSGKAGAKIDDSTSRDVGAMVARFDKSIRAGIDAFKRQHRSGDFHLTQMPTGTVPVELRNKNGVGEYMVAFDVSGTPGKIWPIASYPTPDIGAGLRSQLDHAHANSVSDSQKTRYMLVPVHLYSTKARQLRAHH